MSLQEDKVQYRYKYWISFRSVAQFYQLLMYITPNFMSTKPKSVTKPKSTTKTTSKTVEPKKSAVVAKPVIKPEPVKPVVNPMYKCDNCEK